MTNAKLADLQRCAGARDAELAQLKGEHARLLEEHAELLERHRPFMVAPADSDQCADLDQLFLKRNVREAIKAKPDMQAFLADQLRYIWSGLHVVWAWNAASWGWGNPLVLGSISPHPCRTSEVHAIMRTA